MNISAVLLAGGESRRMGKDKATLLFHGKPLWQIQLELLRKLARIEIFVSARTDPLWRPADLQFVADDPPSHGPLSGLGAVLARMHTKHLLALAIDMPFMTEKYLRFLCSQIEPTSGYASRRAGKKIVPEFKRAYRPGGAVATALWAVCSRKSPNLHDRPQAGGYRISRTAKDALASQLRLLDRFRCVLRS